MLYLLKSLQGGSLANQVVPVNKAFKKTFKNNVPTPKPAHQMVEYQSPKEFPAPKGKCEPKKRRGNKRQKSLGPK